MLFVVFAALLRTVALAVSLHFILLSLQNGTKPSSSVEVWCAISTKLPSANFFAEGQRANILGPLGPSGLCWVFFVVGIFITFNLSKSLTAGPQTVLDGLPSANPTLGTEPWCASRTRRPAGGLPVPSLGNKRAEAALSAAFRRKNAEQLQHFFYCLY